MKNILSLIILFVLFSITTALPANETTGSRYYFEKLNSTHGLSQNTVYAILQDQTGFMWFGTKDGLNRYDGQSFQCYKKDYNNPYSLGNNFVTALYQDKNEIIWVGTDAGIWLFDPLSESFRPFDKRTKDNSKIERTINSITVDDNDYIWILSNTHTIHCYEPTTDTLKTYAFPQINSDICSFLKHPSGVYWIGTYKDGLFYSDDNLASIKPFTDYRGTEIFKNDVISKIYAGTYNRLYFSSEKEGLKELNLTTLTVRQLQLETDKDGLIFVRDFISYSDQEFWIGTESGLFVYNLETETFKHLKSSYYDPYAISDNAIYSLYKDHQDGIWIGSYFGGLNYLPRQFTYFEKFYPTGLSSDIQARRVREITKGLNGNLWVGTEDNGLYKFNTHTQQFQLFEPSRDFTNVHGLCMVGENLWVGTFQKGIKVISPDNRIIKTYLQNNSPGSLIDNSIYTICKTNAGDIYIGTLFGLQRYNPETDSFTTIEELKGIFIYDIKEDTYGNIWLATYVNGLYKLDIHDQEWKHYSYQPEDPTAIPSNKVCAIFEDSRRQLWFATQGGGFSCYMAATDNFQTFNSGNGFPFDVVYQIIEDNEENFWITTNNGLVRLNSVDMSYRIYTEQDGLLNNQFNYKSAYKDENGKIYIGNMEGMIAFDYRSFAPNPYTPPIVLTDFLLFNQKVEVGKKESPLKRSITYSDKLILNSRQNTFTFHTALLSYQSFRSARLIYKLEGLDKEWFPLTGNSAITYSNIPHGRYTLHVQAVRNSGEMIGEKTSLEIRILPPLYLSTVAILLYILLGLGMIFILIHFLKNKSKIREQRNMELFNQEKERELHSSKIEFFTHVAHEIRTPLTLINGPLDHLLKKDGLPDEMVEDLRIMSKNTHRLLNLTNQLLDFRKTEINGFRINYIEYNIKEILKETHTRFIPLIKQRQLQFSIQIPETDLIAHVDKEAFIKIISNLFNNAIKYAETRVTVCLQTFLNKNEDFFEIVVSNDGKTIPSSMKEEIFKPFVRMNEEETGKLTPGTGIGLALARSLAELHQGKLFMDDRDDLNSFCLQLPVWHKEVIQLSQSDETVLSYQTVNKETDSTKIDESHPTILVVEDNPEMRSFIARQLKPLYNIYTASNGLEALNILDQYEVNLIVCDILMPIMNGYEFCKKIKSDLSYSHIPIILLTAKTNIQSKIEGMEAGADSYIEKPFSNDYLQACINNLLQSRASLREAFEQSPSAHVKTIAVTRQDEEFLQRLMEVIEENMKNPNLNTDDMAELLFMSRSSFYRKIKGIVGMTPNDFLRLERLKKAARLLKEEDTFVNEVCYMVGFNSPSYFSKCFYKQFGVLPKDYTGKHKNEEKLLE